MAGGSVATSSSGDGTNTTSETVQTNSNGSSATPTMQFSMSTTVTATPSILSRTNGGVGSSSGLFATFNSLMDNDPEASRRANISKTRERIQTLESERDRGLKELGAANEAVQRDLDRFQRDKVHDLRNMLMGYAVAMRDSSRKAARAWEEAKAEIGKV